MKAFVISLVTIFLSGQMIAQSIDSWEYIKLGGTEQSVWIRGENADNPILLILHGGPGFSEAMFFRSYNKGLEENFTVVNWDQRGAHQSYNDSIDPESMNIQQFVDDTHELLEELKGRFNKKKVFLLGHSWGSVIGLKTALQHPEDLLAYIGVGQLARGKENEMVSLEYTIAQAVKRRNIDAIVELRKIEQAYRKDGPGSLKDLELQRNWLLEFGGVFYGDGSYSDIFQSVEPPEKAFYNKKAAAEGEVFSMHSLWDEIINEVDFFKIDKPSQVPVYFMIGLSDFNTPFELTEKLYEDINAPDKAIYRFEESGHFIPFEEPQKFEETMNVILQKTKGIVETKDEHK